MDIAAACPALAALAHETRLKAFRMLLAAGDDGVPSGVLAERLGVKANTMSANLSVLAEAGLATPHRDGKIVRYRAEVGPVRALIDFLVGDDAPGAAPSTPEAEERPRKPGPACETRLQRQGVDWSPPRRRS